jgi:hypothetical protein
MLNFAVNTIIIKLCNDLNIMKLEIIILIRSRNKDINRNV